MLIIITFRQSWKKIWGKLFFFFLFSLICMFLETDSYSSLIWMDVTLMLPNLPFAERQTFRPSLLLTVADYLIFTLLICQDYFWKTVLFFLQGHHQPLAFL